MILIKGTFQIHSFMSHLFFRIFVLIYSTNLF